MEELNESLHLELLDFDVTKRREWIERRKPFSVLFELTPRCNFACVHCYLQESHKNDELSLSEIKAIIDILYEQGILFLTLTGGEAMLRSDFLDIYMYAKRRGFLVEVFTNGSCFSQEILDAMEKYPPLLVDVSLYGATAETYEKVTGKHKAFKTVLNNCAEMKRRNIRFSLKTPVITLTLPELDGMKELANSYGVKLVYSYSIIPTTERNKRSQNYQVPQYIALENEFEDYERQINDRLRSPGVNEEKAQKVSADTHLFTCNVATNSFLVDYKGNICPCVRLRHHGEPLTKEGFEGLWQKFATYADIKASPTFRCLNCKSRYFCDTCPGEADLMNKNLEAISLPICKTARIRRLFYEGLKTKEECLELAGKPKDRRWQDDLQQTRSQED